MALKSQFENYQDFSQKLLPSKIIGFQGKYSNPSTLIISKGKNDGIKEGMAVISGKELVGKTGKVSSNFSSITLVNNENFSTVGKTGQGALGIIKGENDFVLFDRVVITDKLSNDNAVMTKGDINDQGSGIPPDLIVGKIISINKGESKPFQSAEIKPLIDFSRLETVFVVIGN